MAARSSGRARYIEPGLVLILLLAALAAWFLTERLAGDSMQLGILTGMGSQTDGSMNAGMLEMGDQSMALTFFLATWLLMMIAMMFPAVSPVVMIYRRWAGERRRGPGGVPAFLGGYLFVWGATGIVAFGLMRALEEWGPQGPAAVRAGALVLAVAGLYQLTPAKDVCLKACRSPLGFLMKHGETLKRRYGSFRVGAHHGFYCLGCCWALMVLLVALGMMNLAWMGFVAAVILIEKILPAGDAIARTVGVAMIALAALLVVSPGTLPAFT